jgi:hypothetical protein
MGLHTAQFSFKSLKGRHEIFDVQARPNESIKHAVVIRIISIIRKDYLGEFEWESNRLGRTVVLNASLEKDAELQDFIFKEFFGSE